MTKQPPAKPGKYILIETVESTRKAKVLRVVMIASKFVLVLKEFDLEVAYQIKPGNVIRFIGFVGPNGPSKGKLKHAAMLAPKNYRNLLGQTYTLA